MDLRRLREETRLEHEATEAAMPLMVPGLTLPAYKDVLRLLLLIASSWERWAEGHAPDALRPLLPTRRRSHLLEADLRSLGDPDAARQDRSDGEIDWNAVMDRGSADAPGPGDAAFTAAFLGAMYVMEGSTLGGRMIARHMEPVFGFAEGRGALYFRGHGEATGALWRETTAAIAAVPDVDAETVIAAARRTFAAYRSILVRLEPILPAESVHG